jgi:ketosteroid isomerase-like protein
MGLEENKAVVQRLFDAINNGRLDELPQVVAPDVVDHNAVIFMQPEGPAGWRASACCCKGSRTSSS